MLWHLLLGLLLECGWYMYNFNSTNKSNEDRKSDIKEKLTPPNVEIPQPPSWSPLHKYEKAAVCSDASACSNIGRELLQKGGNAVDAAIATLLCNGLVTMQSMGLGGGVLMTFYSFKKRKAISIMGRERAPSYINNETLLKLQNATSLAKSPLAIGVPGEVAAYHEAHQNYGFLPWSHIIQPAIDLCENGYRLSRHQYDALYLNEERIWKDKLLKKMFVNPSTQKFYLPGHQIQIPQVLCKTLRILKKEGPESFYQHTLANLIAQDLREIGCAVQPEDLKSYKVEVKEVLTINVGTMSIHLPPPPGSGHVLAFIINLLKHFEAEFQKNSELTALDMHRLVEACKFGFVKRWEYDTQVDNETLFKLISNSYAQEFLQLINDSKTFDNPTYYGADPNLLPIQDSGTAQICVLAPNGDAISATSSINYYFGSGYMGSRTGILFNNAMADFTIANFKNYFELPNIPQRNLIEPGKQPMSSVVPLIISDRQSGKVRLIIGAAGGTRIISTLTGILVRILWFQQNIKQAIDAPRFHHQLLPNVFQYEFGLLQQTVEILERKGHQTQRIRNKNTAACGIERIKDTIQANADYRKEGAVAGF